MSRTIFTRLSALLLTLAGAWTAYTFQGKQAAAPAAKAPPAPLVLNKVADDLYMIEGSGGNSTVYVTDEGVILVDDKFDQNFDEIMANIKKVTNQPLKYVINTHTHGDHTGSNAKMLPIAEIIAHKNTRANMIKGKQPGPPRLSFADQFEINLGGKQVLMRYYGRGHTNGDIGVLFPARSVFATGDMGANNGPNPDFANGGSIKEWAATLDGMLKENFQTVIPGHGPVSPRQYLVDYRARTVQIQTRVSTMVREGKNKEAITQALMTEFMVPMNHAIINRLDGMMDELK